MPISLTISDLHAEFHDLAVKFGYVRTADVPSVLQAMRAMATKHDMQQAEPVAEAEEQPAEKFEAPVESVTEPEKKPRGRPRKQAEPEVVVEVVTEAVADVNAELAVRYTLADVTQALRNIVKAYNYKEEPARQLFKDFGVAKISELPVERYAAFIAESAARCEAAPK